MAETGKKLAKAKQRPQTELLLFETHLIYSFTL